MSGEVEGCLLGEKGVDEEDELLFIGDDEEVGEDEAEMAVDYVEEEGSGENGGYCTPDEKECKSMVNMDCVTVEAPQVGMIFDTWQEADLYYNAYGKQQGFGVVLAQSAYKVVGGVKVKRATTWKCDCYGKPDTRRKVGGKRLARELEGEPIATKKSKKCGCLAKVYAGLVENGKWELKKVELEHTNHNPTPSKALLVPKYRMAELERMPHVRKRLKFADDVGISTSTMHNLMASERNGLQNMRFTKKDLHNLRSREKKLKFKDGDANAMMKYFEMMQTNNKNFFHMQRLDKHGVLQDVLWLDARSRAAYEDFGDVVCFDTTFLLNKYDLPFANFVGVNHHGQTILLGCALISRENTETFKWVFSTWIAAVGGTPPMAILTDQDPAMRKALKEVMPQTRHRWCIWHITEKFGSKLGKCKGYAEFKDELKNIIYDSLSMQEFELRWTEFIATHKLESNLWLAVLYSEREMWIPAAMKHMFWAGMKTTQRSESIHNFFDEFFDKHTGLCDFAERYIRAMEHRIDAERLADGNSAMYLRTLLTDFKIEETFRNVYTDAKFVEVQRECKRLMYCNCSSIKEIEEGLYEHLIKDRVYIYSDIDKKEKPINRWRVYRVLYNSKTQEVECECRLFQCNGILCRHCINALESQQIPDVPKKYILDRWQKDIYRKHTRVQVAYHDLSKTEEVLRYDKMMVAFEPISCLASENDEALKLVLDGLQHLEMQIKKVVKPAPPMSSVGEAMTNSTPHSVNKAPQLCTPSSVGRSVVVGAHLVESGEDDHAGVSLEVPVDGGIKDPPTNRGPGCVRATRFMTTYEEVCRQKEERRKKFAEKQRRKERAKKKQEDASCDDHEMIDTGVARQIDFDHSLSQSLQCSEDTVGNQFFLGQDGVAFECGDLSEQCCNDGVMLQDDFIVRNGVQWG